MRDWQGRAAHSAKSFLCRILVDRYGYKRFEPITHHLSHGYIIDRSDQYEPDSVPLESGEQPYEDPDAKAANLFSLEIRELIFKRNDDVRNGSYNDDEG